MVHAFVSNSSIEMGPGKGQLENREELTKSGQPSAITIDHDSRHAGESQDSRHGGSLGSNAQGRCHGGDKHAYIDMLSLKGMIQEAVKAAIEENILHDLPSLIASSVQHVLTGELEVMIDRAFMRHHQSRHYVPNNTVAPMDGNIQVCQDPSMSALSPRNQSIPATSMETASADSLTQDAAICTDLSETDLVYDSDGSVRKRRRSNGVNRVISPQSQTFDSTTNMLSTVSLYPLPSPSAATMPVLIPPHCHSHMSTSPHIPVHRGFAAVQQHAFGSASALPGQMAPAQRLLGCTPNRPQLQNLRRCSSIKEDMRLVDQDLLEELCSTARCQIRDAYSCFSTGIARPSQVAKDAIDVAIVGMLKAGVDFCPSRRSKDTGTDHEAVDKPHATNGSTSTLLHQQPSPCPNTIRLLDRVGVKVDLRLVQVAFSKLDAWIKQIKLKEKKYNKTAAEILQSLNMPAWQKNVSPDMITTNHAGLEPIYFTSEMEEEPIDSPSSSSTNMVIPAKTMAGGTEARPMNLSSGLHGSEPLSSLFDQITPGIASATPPFKHADMGPMLGPSVDFSDASGE